MGNWDLLKNLLIEEKVLSQKETVSTIENTVIMQVVDRLVSSTKIEKALRILDRAIQCQEAKVPLYLKKSQILRSEGYVDNAIHVLKSAYNRDTTNLEIILDIIQTYKCAGDINGGIAFADECLNQELFGLEIEVLLAKLNLMHLMDDEDGSFDLAIQLVFEYSDDHGVFDVFNNIVGSYKLHKEAIKVLEDVVEANPYSEKAWYALGHFYYHQSRYDEARMAYEYAFLIEPNFEEAYRHYISVALDTQAYRKALKAYSEMIERFTLDSSDMIAIANCYIHFKDYQRATKFLEHGLKKDRRNADLYYKLALVYSEQGNFAFAINYINKAIRIDDQFDDYHLLNARIQYKSKNIQKAIASFRKAVAIAPMIHEIWEYFIQLLIEEKNYGLGLSIIDEAEMESGSPLFAYYKAICLIGSGHKEDGLVVLENALVESFDEHEVIFDLVPELHNNKQIKSMIAYYLFEEE